MAAGSVDDEINLESLKALKLVFQSADEDGSGELDIDEFCSKLGPHLGANLTQQQIRQLFLKIDADAGGTVDWDEFTNFMFLERAQQAAGEGDSENWRLFPQEFRDRNEASCNHRDLVDRVYYVGTIDKYVTCGRDGSFRLWNAPDLKHARTVSNGSSWITDCTYLPQSRRMVFTSMDRAISTYDINRGSYDLTGRVYASGDMGVPLCLQVLSGDAGERVVYGDSEGSTILLLCGGRELPARDLISTDDHKDYIRLHREHSDWVTRLEWIPEIGLVTSSLDATIKVWDIARERVSHVCTHHAKGVHGFVWCRPYSLFASCGIERGVMVWQGNTGRKVGELRGHTSSVTSIALDEHLNHVFTMAVDRTIKVWDLRNHKCLQTITEDDWVRHDDARPGCMMYDNSRRRLVTAASRPYVWHHKVVSLDRTGHREPLRGVIYNATFHVAVSVDEGGTVCVWRMQDGSREGRFSNAHGTSRVTAISFDRNERRLVTAANDASLRMWNFNNGSMLRSFEHDQEQLEVTCVLFARDDKRGSDAVYAAGWNHKVFVWQDEDEPTVSQYRTFEGHRADILAMAACHTRALLATGDADGGIYIWGLFSGERKSGLRAGAHTIEMADGLLSTAGAGTAAGDPCTGCKQTVPPELTSSRPDTTGADTFRGGAGSVAASRPGTTASAEAAAAGAAGSSPLRGSSSAGQRARGGPAAPRPGSPLRPGSRALQSGGPPSAGSRCGSAGRQGVSPPPTGVAGTAASVEALAWLEAWSPAQRAERRARAEAAAAEEAAAADQRAEMEAAADAQGDEDRTPQPPGTALHSARGQRQEPHPQQLLQQRLYRSLSSTGHNAASLAAAEAAAAAVGGDSSGSGNGNAGNLSSGGGSEASSRPGTSRPGTHGSTGSAEAERPQALLLLAGCGDGRVHVWSVNASLGTGRLLFTLPGAQGRLDVVSTARVSPNGEWFVTGDTGGHMRVWDISAGIDSSTPAACRASFVQRSHWRAHSGAVAGLDFVQGGNIPLLVTAGRDCNVALWCLEAGCLVGVLGEDSWDVKDPSTWADSGGPKARPPLEPDSGIYGGGAGEVAARGSGATAAGRRRTRQQGVSGLGEVAEQQQEQSSSAQPSPSQQQQQHSWQRWDAPIPWAGGAGGCGGRSTVDAQPDGVACAAAAAAEGLQEVGGVPLAQLMLQDRKARVQCASAAPPEQPHGRLRVHALDAAALSSVEALLAASAERRREKAAAAAAQHGGGGIGGTGGVSSSSRATVGSRAASAVGAYSAAARLAASAAGRAAASGAH